MMVGKLTLTWKGKEQSIEDCENYSFNGCGFKENIERSINFDTTENIIIEGDNLDVLKLLQSEYQSKVKMIYIDPPYNTGNKGLYKDKYWKARECKHSNWLNMMYPRLKLARELLRDDGVIFVSIDDHEQANLKLLMDEIFGEDMFVAMFPWKKRAFKSDVPYYISQDYEWVLCYANSSFLAGRKANRKYYKTDDYDDEWRVHPCTTANTKEDRPNSFFDLVNTKNNEIFKANPNRVWKISLKTIDQHRRLGKIIFPNDYDFLKSKQPLFRIFKAEDIAKKGKDFDVGAISTHLDTKIVGMSANGTKDFEGIFSSRFFSHPKPIKLIKYLLEVSTKESDIILDFFAGSGTTGHAVMQLNMEDKKQAIENGEDPELVGNRKYIMVQFPEEIKEGTEAYKAGYKKISDITIERVKRAGNKIREENPDVNLDVGFKVCELIS